MVITPNTIIVPPVFFDVETTIRIKAERICECPTCWTLQPDNERCLPDSDKFDVACSLAGMKTTIDECIFAAPDETVTLAYQDKAWVQQRLFHPGRGGGN